MSAYEVLVAAWWLFGVAGFVFWWTRDNDFTVSELPLVFIVGIIGPFAWLAGWAIHGRSGNSPVIFKRKKWEQ